MTDSSAFDKEGCAEQRHNSFLACSASPTVACAVLSAERVLERQLALLHLSQPCSLESSDDEDSLAADIRNLSGLTDSIREELQAIDDEFWKQSSPRRSHRPNDHQPPLNTISLDTTSTVGGELPHVDAASDTEASSDAEAEARMSLRKVKKLHWTTLTPSLLHSRVYNSSLLGPWLDGQLHEQTSEHVPVLGCVSLVELAMLLEARQTSSDPMSGNASLS